MYNTNMEETRGFFSNFKKAHSTYFGTLWYISLSIGLLYGVYTWFLYITDAVKTGSFVGFLFALIFQTFIIMLNAIVTAFFMFLIIVFFTLLPYLIIRGLVAK